MAAAAGSKLRSSCSFQNLILSCLNLILFLLSAASLAPTVLLRTPPTSLGVAFLMVSSMSLVSAFIGLCCHLSRLCFGTHMSVLLASLAGQLLAVLALFTKERASLSMFDSMRDPREAKLLVRLECGILMAMMMLQTVVLVMTCAVHSCWVREYEGLGAEKEATEKKRSMRAAKVQEESMANAEKKGVEEEEMKKRYAVWVKNDFEG